MARRRFRWLHLTDLHAGMDEPRWATVEQVFLDDVEEQIAPDPIDAVLFTGDLTQYARPGDFQALEAFLEKLWARFQVVRQNPVLLAVPGNHDLVRPKYPPSLTEADRDAFWRDPTHPARKVLDDAFGPWRQWWATARPRGVEDGLLPGEFRWSSGQEGLRVGVVGLNTAALHLRDDVQGRLLADHRQLRAPWPDFDDWHHDHDVCLLLSHHDPSWLAPTSRVEWDTDLHDPARFALHLYGHEHLATSESIARDGGLLRHRERGHALFGKEGSSREFGYALHTIDVDDARRRRWSANHRRKVIQGGRHVFVEHDAFARGAVDLGRAPWRLGVPRGDVRANVVAFLTAHFDHPRVRRSLLRDLEIVDDRSWAEVVPGLEPATLERLLTLALADEPELRQPIERLLAGVRGLAGEEDPQVRAAAAHLNAGRYADAAAALEGLLATASDPWVKHRALVNLAAARLGQGQRPAARRALDRVSEQYLRDPSRVRAARWWVAVGDPERAESLLGSSEGREAEAVRQLIALHRGQEVPDPVDDADVLDTCAARALSAGDARAAWALVERAWATGPHREILALGVQVLYDHWFGAAVPVGDPAGTLGRLRAWHAEVGDEETGLGLDALEMLPPGGPTSEPVTSTADPRLAWLPDAEAVVGADPDALREIVKRSLGCGPVLLAAAGRWLDLGEPDEALTAARRAFALLPGYGQRAELVRALLSTGRFDEADAHLPALSPPRSPSARRVLAYQYQRRMRFTDVLAVVDGWEGSGEPWVWRAAAEHGLGRFEDALRSAREALKSASLTPFGLAQLVPVVAGGGAIYSDLANQLMAALEREDLRGDPAAEALRLQLHLGGAASPRPVDFAALEGVGVVHRVGENELRQLIEERRSRQVVVGRLWNLGALTFESWAGLQDLPAGLAGVAVRNGEFVVVPPVRAVAEWAGRWCLMGGLALEVLAALDLVQEVGRHLAGVVVLEDTYARFQSTAGVSSVAAWQRERSETVETWGPFERLPRCKPADHDDVLDGEKVPGAIAWLASIGEIPARQEPVWEPPNKFVIDGTAVHVLARSGLARRFLDACRDRGRMAAIDERSIQLRESRLEWLRNLIAASQVADAVRSWLGSLATRGALRIEPVPPPPEMPPSTDLLRDDPAVLRSFAVRELLAKDGALVAFTSEFSEVGVGGAVPAVLVGRAWTHASYTLIRDRYAAATAARVVSLGEVCRAVVSDERRAEVTGALAKAGYSDALGAADLLALQQAFGSLEAAEPRRQLVGMLRGAGMPGLPHGALYPLPLVGAFAEAIDRRWFEGAGAGREEDAADLLAAVAWLDDQTGARHRLVESVVTYLLAGSVPNRVSAFAEIDADSVTPDPSKAGPELWRLVAGWAVRSKRWGSVSMGLARLFQRRTLLPPWFWEVFVPLIVPALPGRGDRLDLTDRSLAALWNDAVGRKALDRVVSRGRSLAAWRDAAVSHALEGEWSATRCHIPVDGVEVVLPLEALWPEVRTHANEMAEYMWAVNPAVSHAFAGYAANVDALPQLRDALDRSVLADVEADPTLPLSWSPWGDRQSSGPRNVAALRALLAEPPVTSQPASERWAAALAGEWKGRPTDLLVEVMQHVPAFSGAGADHARAAFAAHPEAFVEALRNPDALSTGQLSSMIVGLAQAARTAPVRTAGDHVESVPDLVARMAVVALDERSRPMAEHECALVRHAAAVVERFVEPPEPDRAWLSWRLYGWWRRILEHRLADLARLAELAPAPKPATECAGLFDPWRMAPDRVNLREVLVLRAVAGLDPAQVSVTWSALVPTLTRIASRRATPEEVGLRGGDDLCASDLARWLLLRHDPAVVWGLDAETRMTWLDESLRDASGAFGAVGERVVSAWATRPDRWSDAERRRIYTALGGDLPALPAWTHLLAVASGFDDAPDSVPTRARTEVWARLSEEKRGPTLTAVWLLAQAMRGTFSEAADELLAEVGRQGLDPVPFLHALTAPVLASTGALATLARPIVRQKLAAHPATPTDERLREILAVLQEGTP